MTEKLITDLLAAPLDPEWTIDRLAEDILAILGTWRPDDKAFIVIDSYFIRDRQSSRLLRPLLAFLATKSAAEEARPINLYGGHIGFSRSGPNGPVSIYGDFENTATRTRVTFGRYFELSFRLSSGPLLTGRYPELHPPSIKPGTSSSDQGLVTKGEIENKK